MLAKSKTVQTTVGSLLGLSLLMGFSLIAPTALAKDGDIIREGSCSGRSDWKLKASPENRRIEVEFEVDQNRVGQRWRVVLRQDGNIVFQGIRTTQAPSGSFEVRQLLVNRRGRDRIQARAVNLASGEVCRGGLRVTF